ncbi:MAG: ATP-dependent zinc protease [Alphaproteobacteria bacterium]|nr:MAG: ATP-dependent zinc protease [Alphaproteobacteria bacterium]
MRPLIGWRERVDLPDLGVFGLKAKIDTGARTSALHVENVAEFTGPDGAPWLRFDIPIGNGGGAPQMVNCEVPSGGVRRVKSSTGHLQRRRSIRTHLRIGDYEVEIDITLADRNAMLHPMLLGRTALRNHFLINPGRSFLLSDRETATRTAAPPQRRHRNAGGTGDSQ